MFLFVCLFFQDELSFISKAIAVDFFFIAMDAEHVKITCLA